MAQSQDLFMETIDLFVLYLSDGSLHLFEGYQTDVGLITSGDIIPVPRAALRDEDPEQFAVVLGWGITRDEALRVAETYYRRVAMIHGNENASQITFTRDDNDASSSSSTYDSEGERFLERERERRKASD